MEKEALAIVYAVKKFHQYIYGREVEIITDHKPLTSLFHEKKGEPTMASARIQRWSLTLSTYNYKLRFKSGKHNNNADALSRMPLSDMPAFVPVPNDTIFLVEYLNSSPVTVKNIKFWTNRDPVLSSVMKFILHGWPNHMQDPILRPYTARKLELSVHDACILWGSRVIVPKPGQQKIMDELHSTHPGISRMKSLARNYVWWPKLDDDLENKVRSCSICQVNRNKPKQSPLYPWEYPSSPWSRLHLDFAGPFMNNMFLILIDANTKWMEVSRMHSITATATIEKLRSIFATHGLPEVIVTDNDSTFTSQQFQEFIKLNGITHKTSAPYSPQTNGLAERAIQIFKTSMRKMSEGSIDTKISRFLFQYRNTPQTITGISPSELLFSRRPRCHLDLLYPNLKNQVHQKQMKQKEFYDQNKQHRSFSVGEKVYVRNFQSGPRWLPGIIEENKGPTSYYVLLSDDRVVRKHVDQIRIRHDKEVNQDKELVVKPEFLSVINNPNFNVENQREGDKVTSEHRDHYEPDQGLEQELEADSHDTVETPVVQQAAPEHATPELCRSTCSTRIRREPDRLNLYLEQPKEIFV